MGKGDRIAVILGDGRECVVAITAASPTEVKGEILSVNVVDYEAKVKITLIQCVPKGDKMDQVVQKCVEIGVTTIIPAISERTVVRIQPDRADRKVERWRRIAEEAGKQCGRSHVPVVADLATFENAIKSSSPDSLRLIPYELETERSLKSVLEEIKPSSVVLCIGPEGGFSKEEVLLAESHGFVPVTLGRRILRTETAGLVVAACILYHMDELG